MFNFGPSMGMMKRLLPGQGPGSGNMMPGPDMGFARGGPPSPDMGDGGGMPSINVGPFNRFPGMPPPSPEGGMGMPPMLDSPPPTFPGAPPMMPPPQQSGMGRMFQGMQNKMSPNRPGMWGKFNQISQAAQPAAMNMLRSRGAQPPNRY